MGKVSNNIEDMDLIAAQKIFFKSRILNFLKYPKIDSNGIIDTYNSLIANIVKALKKEEDNKNHKIVIGENDNNILLNETLSYTSYEINLIRFLSHTKSYLALFKNKISNEKFKIRHLREAFEYDKEAIDLAEASLKYDNLIIDKEDINIKECIDELIMDSTQILKSNTKNKVKSLKTKILKGKDKDYYFPIAKCFKKLHKWKHRILQNYIDYSEQLKKDLRHKVIIHKNIAIKYCLFSSLDFLNRDNIEEMQPLGLKDIVGYYLPKFLKNVKKIPNDSNYLEKNKRHIAFLYSRLYQENFNSLQKAIEPLFPELENYMRNSYVVKSKSN